MRRGRPGSRPACRPGSRATSAGIERFAAMLVEATGAVRRGHQAKPRVLRGASVRPGWPPSSGSGRACPADLPVVADAKRGDISTTAAHQAVALFDRPRSGRGDGQSVRRARRASSRSSPARTGSPTSCAGRRTRAPPSCRACIVEADPARRRAGRAALPPRGAPRRDLGAGSDVGLVVGATAPDELRAVRAAVPDLPVLVPGIGTQGGDARGRPRRRTRRPAADAVGRPGRGLLVNVSRGIAGAALDSRRRVAPGTRAALRGGRPRLGGAPPCATLAGASDAPARHDGRPGPLSSPAGAPTIMPTPGPLELVIILVIALLILGPGKLPDVGAALGKSIREFRKASSDVQDAVKVNVDTSPLPTPSSSAPAVPSAHRADARHQASRSPPARRATRTRSPNSRRATRRPWLTPTRCARRASPALPDRPRHRRTSARRRPAGRLGHVARRPSRRAADPPVPLDPGGRRRRGPRVRRLRPGDHDPRSADPDATRRCSSPGSATPSSSRSRSRS